MSGHGLLSREQMENARQLQRDQEPAPTRPEEFVEAAAERTVRSFSGHLGGSSPLAIELCGVLIGEFWRFQGRVLDLIHVMARDDYQWQTAKRATQDIQNEQLRTMNAIIHQIVAQHAAAGAPPAEEASGEQG